MQTGRCTYIYYRICFLLFSYPSALEMVASGRIDLKPLVTHRFVLEQVSDAFEAAKSGKGIKVLIECHQQH